eukprot:UN06734
MAALTGMFEQKDRDRDVSPPPRSPRHRSTRSREIPAVFQQKPQRKHVHICPYSKMSKFCKGKILPADDHEFIDGEKWHKECVTDKKIQKALD